MFQPFKNIFIKPQALFIWLTIALVGCAQFDVPEPITKPITISGQPGDYFVKQIKTQKLSHPEEVVAMLQQSSYQSQKNNTYLIKNPQDTAKLLLSISRSEEVSQAIIQLSNTLNDKNEKWIVLALKLYPIDAYRIVEQLYIDSDFQKSTLKSAALLAGLEPNKIFTATATSDVEYRVVPLIHSASLTVYNQYEDSTTRLWFKPSTSSEWLPALALQWDPIRGALSGSIVRLKPDTAYDIKLEYLGNTQVIKERFYNFETRPNSPPINPNKIYYLSDIYNGGQLNLTALGIEGTEDGWALIIGDGVTVTANDDDLSAIEIGSQNYVKLENITSKGGIRYGIHGYKAHHIWISGCDISEYGREGQDIRNGVAYDTTESTGPINYDSGIYLERSGVVVIEGCEIHSPNGKANSWEHGHPKGPNALQVWGYHRNEAYRGQYIVRNNRFYGAPDHRFNDVIEGRGNRKSNGGFGNDSAIYNNYLAYANDDLIEIDGGQANVLVYNNEMTQGYCGISTAPNMIGPSYVFHNYIHDLGDERGKEWTAIKMGGLISSPAGKTNVFENIIVTNRNGISASSVNGDRTFWLNAQNNIIISRQYRNMVGYGIYDKQFYEGSEFKNNVIYNMAYGAPLVQANIDDDFYHPWSEQADKINEIVYSNASFNLESDARFDIPNFSRKTMVTSSDADFSSSSSSSSTSTESVELINFNNKAITSFDNQDKDNNYEITEGGDALTLYGNTWKSVDITQTLTPQTMIEFEMKSNGAGEIAGIAFENDNKVTSSRLYKFAGSQNWNNDIFKYNNSGEFETIRLPVGQFSIGDLDRLVFVMDDDKPSSTFAQVTFKNLKFYELNPVKSPKGFSGSRIRVGLSSDK
jgi:hypothetical protein